MFLHNLLLFYIAVLVKLSPVASISQDAVGKAISAFQTQCFRQQVLLPPLLEALRVMDLERSRAAYISARPPYEQIETHAGVFPELDQAIDARPDVFEFGEDNPAFRGFHRIERDIYRDMDLRGSYKTGLTLNNSINDLCDVLRDVSRFNTESIWDGILALAYEVPAKKISSEEETFSDLSMMIFRNNFQGIWSQAKPFFELESVSKQLQTKANYRYKVLQNVLNEVDPDNDFFTDSGNAKPYSSVTTKQRKKISDAAYRFADTLHEIRDLIVPGSSDEEEEEEGDASGLSATCYADETAAGVSFFSKKCKEQLELFGSLEKAINNGSLSMARKVYGKVRPPYEQIETLAPSFPILDRDIDARPYVFPTGEHDPEWKGFHLLERQIFRDHDLEGAKKAIGVLRGSITTLCEVLENKAMPSPFDAELSWQGILALVYEVPAKKISSEEETFSDLSVMIFRENVLGIHSQVAPFFPRMPKKLATKLERKYRETIDYLIYVVDRDNDGQTGTNFAKYSDVPVWQKRTISRLFNSYGRALREAYDALLEGCL